MALKMEEATWQGMWVNPRSWVHPLVDSQQGNRDFSLTTTNKEILPQPQDLEENLSSRGDAPAGCLPGTWCRNSSERGSGQQRAKSGGASGGLRGRVVVALAQNLMVEPLLARKESATGPSHSEPGPKLHGWAGSSQGASPGFPAFIITNLESKKTQNKALFSAS